MSVGEIANLYRDGELDIHPEFQRFYRWSPEQKSRFIESILLGIPIPSLFVAQRTDGKWDVIDGLQRLSTIFHLMGILQDQDGKKVPPLVLTATKYLPALEGCVWSAKQGRQPLSMAQQLLIKRSKLDIKIILRESDEGAKFELFQRLNTGGSPLSHQEIRNAMLVAGNPQFFKWLQEELASYPSFRDCVVLSERAYDERYDVELVLRFIVLRTLNESTLQRTGDIGDFLTDAMTDMSPKFPEFHEREESAFKNTFDLLAEYVGADAFRRYDASRNRFTGGFLISAFEAVALGLGFHTSGPISFSQQELLKRIQGLWSNQVFVNSSGMGVRASTRIPKVVKLGRELFKP
ncbi:MAG: DUF262 domain-containing protein [Planctomycetaceae bacterium]|nr:MAG: DUF262 domain-containing protein [Planctomycetaceae bacterium]